MSVRRNTENRKILARECGTCGKTFITTASSPWIRQIERDGKKQATTYFCSSKCFQASYKHIGFYDGKAEQRRKEREAKRDYKEKNRKYYAAHAEELRERARKYREQHAEEVRLNNSYYRQKRKLLDVG